MSDLRKAGIVTNTKRDTDFTKTRKIVRILEENGVEAVVPDFREGICYPGDGAYGGMDFIISLGGDGTILSVAEKAAMSGIPIMGINIGNLGYLTDCSFEETEEAVKRLISGSYTRQRRLMLKAEINSHGKTVSVGSCLNEVCIIRGAMSKIILFDLMINGSFVDNYSADGIIISTPTGSTAYNLSAGGPILIPSTEMVAITPVCPHMLTTRPIVAAAEGEITIKIGDTKKEVMLTLDGRAPALLKGGDIIRIFKSENSVEIIKTNKLDFYDILRKKLIYASAVDL